VMSSIAAGCDHIDHVSTQLPYAVTVMIVALGVGYLAVALGAPIWLPYAVGPLLLGGVLLTLGRRIER
jgi:Na+/H+ antiporter NhaC